ncbi:hypothetical protein ACQP1U_10395 [Actinomycetota bacterium]
MGLTRGSATALAALVIAGSMATSACTSRRIGSVGQSSTQAPDPTRPVDLPASKTPTKAGATLPAGKWAIVREKNGSGTNTFAVRVNSVSAGRPGDLKGERVRDIAGSGDIDMSDAVPLHVSTSYVVIEGDRFAQRPTLQPVQAPTGGLHSIHGFTLGRHCPDYNEGKDHSSTELGEEIHQCDDYFATGGATITAMRYLLQESPDKQITFTAPAATPRRQG